MAGYVSIENIIPCNNPKTFHAIVHRYLRALVSLGVGETTLFSWGRHLRWPKLEEQIVSEWPRMRGEAGKEFEIKLMILLWGDDKQWKQVSLELLFDIEEVIGPGAPFDPKLICYKRSFGRLAWRIMQVISAQELGYGCYLADEATDCEIFKLLGGEGGHFWWPSLSIAPYEFYQHYLPVSDQTVVKRQDEVGIFALRTHWEVLPWEE